MIPERDEFRSEHILSFFEVVCALLLDEGVEELTDGCAEGFDRSSFVIYREQYPVRRSRLWLILHYVRRVE
jgi:hypothetical protein